MSFPTCILVLTTSRGVFPKTLAAPAVAPNMAVTIGCISFLGSSPSEVTAKDAFMSKDWKSEESQSVKWIEKITATALKQEAAVLTFVPVAKRVHDIKSNGLVCSLFKNSSC